MLHQSMIRFRHFSSCMWQLSSDALKDDGQIFPPNVEYCIQNFFDHGVTYVS